MGKPTKRRWIWIGRRIALLVAACLAAPPGGFAAAPVLDHLFPVTLPAGSTNTITAVGKFEPWPVEFWTSARGVRFECGAKAGELTVAVDAEADPGAHLVRAFHSEGASVPRFLIVTREPAIREKEPNDSFNAPHAIDVLPACVDGRLEKRGDVDSYAIALDAGERLTASVEAYVLGSPLDAVIRLLDARGIQAAWNHDRVETLDPLLEWTAVQSGRYIIQVFGFQHPPDSAVRFTGNDKCVYRLHLSKVDGPAVECCDDAVPAGAAGVLGSEDDETSQAPPLAALPIDATGWISRPGEVDRVGFETVKGETLEVAVECEELNSMLDPWVAIEKWDGGELARNDDSIGVEPRLIWKAPEDGRYVVAVGNVLRRGGAGHDYELKVHRAAPGYRTTITDSMFSIKPGKTNEITVSVTRLHGFNAPIRIEAEGLPATVRCEPVIVPAGEEKGLVRLVAEDAAPAWHGPVQWTAIDLQTWERAPVVSPLTSQTLNNGVPGGFRKLVVEQAESFWLTIPPVAVPSAEQASTE